MRRIAISRPSCDSAERLLLGDDIRSIGPETVLCLGDSFDDLMAAQSLRDDHRATLAGLQAGRRWLWLEGNHDPGPVELGGDHLDTYADGPLVFRHIAQTDAAPGEISGHYHPKARVRRASRPCFMVDRSRVIMPAYGCYTGGLDWTTPVLRDLFDDRAIAYLTGPRVLAVPVPQAA